MLIVLYQFDNKEVDTEHYQVRMDGKTLAVEPKVFDLIVYLIENRERIISRSELFEQVWGGRIVSDTSLSNHIKNARKVLGDSGDRQSIIKTVRSRGYQFIASIEQPTVSIKHVEKKTFNASPVTMQQTNEFRLAQHKQQRRTPYLKLLLISLLIFAAFTTLWQWVTVNGEETSEPYLLVLPFSISSNNTDRWQAFSDQMTRELIQNLRSISELKVVPPPSSFAFKTNKKRSNIKTQLPKVEHLLDGVLSEGKNGELRLTLELENLVTGELLWFGDFDIQTNNENLFVVQSDIAASVSESLKVIILEKEKQVLAQAPTTSLKAYDYYVQGQYQLSMMTHQSVLNSIALFNQAIALDTKFEAAYIAKSNAYRVIMVLFDKPKDILPKVISSAIDVLSINPSSAQVMSHLGIAYVHTWQWEDAWKMLSMAKRKDPSIALTELGFTLYYSAMGDVEGLKRSLERANELDPLNEEIAEWGMWALMMNNEIDAAIKWGNEKKKLHSTIPYPLLSLSVAEYIKGNFDQSIALAEKGVELSQREAFPLILLAQSYAAAGDKIKARSLIKESQTKNQYFCPYETAITYILLDEPDRVFPLLNRAVDYQSNCLIFTRNDPRLKPLSGDIRFIHLLKILGLNDTAVTKYSK